MSEQRINKAVSFLKNQKVASMPMEKRIDFLRNKLTPDELNQAIKKYEEEDELESDEEEEVSSSKEEKSD